MKGKQTQQPEKVLVNFNQEQTETFKINVSITANSLQTVLKEAERLDLEPSKALLLDLLNDHREVVKRSVLAKIGQPQTIGGFKMNTDKLLETLDLPDTSKLESAVNSANSFLQRFNLRGAIDTLFVFDGAEVSANEETVSANLESFKVYAVTDHEKAVANDYLAFVGAWKKIHHRLTLGGFAGGLVHYPSNNLLRQDPTSGEFNVNMEFYNLLISFPC